MVDDEDDEERRQSVRERISELIRGSSIEEVKSIIQGLYAIIQHFTGSRVGVPNQGNDVWMPPPESIVSDPAVLEELQRFKEEIADKPVPENCRRYVYYDPVEARIRSYLICRDTAYQET